MNDRKHKSVGQIKVCSSTKECEISTDYEKE